jgi:hypothetical protein
MRALVWGLVLLLSACVPVAMLRPPEPARGLEASLGVTLFANPFASGNRDPVLPLPYLAVAQGDGQVEFNFSIQWGLRGGVKLGLGPGLALDAGLTVPPLFGPDWSQGVPVVLDGGAILGGDGFYFSPRVHLIPVPTSGGGSWGWAWQPAWQASLGTYRRDWVAEVGALGGFGRLLIHLSAAWRFGTAP